MKLLKKLTIVMAVAVVAAAPLQLQAEELPELKKTGSITVTLKDGDQPVTGEELTLVQVALAVSKNDGVTDAKDRGYALVYTEQFKALQDDLVNSLTEENKAEVAKQIYAYAADPKNNTVGTAGATDESGRVQFSDLSTGLYLVWNSKAAAGYQTIDPFLVTIPVTLFDTEGKITGYTYDVDASPKMAVLSEFEPLVVSDPPVQKVIEGNQPSKKDRFLFTMKRLDTSSPLPVNDNGHVLSIDGDTMTLFADGAEKVEIGTFTFTQEGDYYYEISEVNNGIEGYSYDSSVYWYKYEVRRDESGKKLTVNRFLVRDGGAEGRTEYDGDHVSDTVVFTFTNTFHKKSQAVPVTTDKELLPRTGQLWWPVAVLAAAGIVCVVTGLIAGAKK